MVRTWSKFPTLSLVLSLSLAVVAYGCGNAKTAAPGDGAAKAPAAEAGKTPAAEAGKTPAAEAGKTPAAEANQAPDGAAAPSSPTNGKTSSESAQPAKAPAPTGARRYAVVAGESKASYIAQEKFVNRPLATPAVGTTTALAGELVVDEQGQLQSGTVKADLRQLKSDDDRRDGRLRRQWLESDKYPWSEFTIIAAEGGALSDGQAIKVKLKGTLKVREATRPAEWDATVTRNGDTVRISATTAFKVTDFGFDPPDIAGMLKVDNEMKAEVELVAKVKP